MAVSYGFFDSVGGDRKYSAAEMSQFYDSVITEGVFQNFKGGLAVSAGTGLSVSVAAGRANVQSRWLLNDAALTLSIDAASTTYGRIDAVVMRLSESSRNISIVVKKGTPASSPVAPSLTRSGGTYEMALAYVTVAANASSVSVTDKRSDSSLCGWAAVRESVPGEIDAQLNDMKTGFDGVSYPTPAEQIIGSDTKLQTQITNSDTEIKAIKEQTKLIDGVYYPYFENGSLSNGQPDDSAYYLQYYARTIDFQEWVTSKTIIPDSNTKFYVIAYDPSKTYIGTSAGYTANYELKNNVFASLPAYFKIVIVNRDNSNMTNLINRIEITDSANIESDISTLKTDIVPLQDNLDGNPARYDVFTDYGTTGVKSVNPYRSQKRDYHGKNIVVINHDDLPAQDYLDTRKIYNKYGFTANFNFILRPFTSKAEIEEKTENVRKMVADGNDLGLHAILGSSFWWMNKMFDITPGYSLTFAPTLSEVGTDTGNGKNIFGFPIDSTKKFSDVGFWDIPSNYASQTVQSCSSSDYLTLIGYYTIYKSTYRMEGLDLDGVSRNWTVLQWLEYWYNNLIDDTMGNTSSGWFADYEVGTNTGASYPDATHLKNGKMVFFDDTSNPNYSNPEYQKVGRFNKGFFKGCASCCNYEVEDRCIEVAKAFIQHYFGINKFTNFGRHGVRYVDCIWYDGKTPYDNRDKTILSGEVGRFYHSRTQRFMTQHDVLREAGILMTNHYTPLESIYESQIGLYYGQHDVRYPFFNHTGRINGNIGYLSLFGTGSAYSSQDSVSLEDCQKLLEGVDDVLKFAYEKAGTQVTSKDGTVTKYVRSSIRDYITNIQAAKGTGKIPVFSLDTITDDASHDIAVNEFLKYIRDEGFEVVPMELGRIIAESYDRNESGNFFANPNFTQSIINRFGTSTNVFAYLPDGWAKYPGAVYGSTPGYEVTTESGTRVFTVKAKGQGYNMVHTRFYGLKPGTYTLTFDAKRSDDNGSILIKKQTNADLISPALSDFETVTITDEWATYTKEIVIDAPYVVPYDGTVANQYSHGYENNVSNIIFAVIIGTPSVSDPDHEYTVSIRNCKLALS